MAGRVGESASALNATRHALRGQGVLVGGSTRFKAGLRFCGMLPLSAERTTRGVLMMLLAKEVASSSSHRREWQQASSKRTTSYRKGRTATVTIRGTFLAGRSRE